VSKVLQIGQTLPNGILNLKYNSQNDFSLFFWDDDAATLPSNIAGSVITIEIDGVTFTTGTIVGITNEVTFSITSAVASVTWSKADFTVVMVKTSKRYVLLTGEVQVQK
jgi:hypothetical protein